VSADLWLVDTGPLVAFLNARDRHHPWATEQLAQIQPPLLTCEAVISEACYLLGRLSGGRRAVMALLARSVLEVRFVLQAEVAAVASLMERYADVPMSLADACLVRMVEASPRSRLLTLDSDFQIYRHHRNRQIPAVMPPGLP